MNTVARCLSFIFIASSCLLLFALVPRYNVLDQRADGLSDVLLRRQLVPPGTTSGGGGGDTSSPTSAQSTTPTSAPATTSNPPAQTTSTPAPTTTQQTTTTSAPTAAPQTTSTPSSAAPPTSTSLGSPPTGTLSTTPLAGTRTLTSTELSGSSSTTSAAPSSSTTSASTDSSLSTGSIIGISVAGGVALIGVVAFFIWKFTRKRFSDFDDNEAIKWPELNSHGGGESVSGHALPTNATGRAGFGDDSESTQGKYASSIGTTSTPDPYPGVAADPYAVPPLPHLNPNQPYHDEPENGFYDPYRGPVPNTFNDVGMEGHSGQYRQEAIPMTQMTRSRSPGPQMGYEIGRNSPQPSVGRRSPGPQMAYGNQMMEAPGRLPSPRPQAAYGGR